MDPYALSHLSDGALLQGLTALVARERTTTATLLAHLAEVDSRRLYLPATYPSMYAYCVGELGLSEDAAYKRIQAARVARQFPVLFAALADGRLHLTAVVLLAPYLTQENIDELLAAAAGKTKSEIEELLAQRFPRSETMALVQALPASPLAPAQVGAHEPMPGASCPRHLPRGKLARGARSWRRWHPSDSCSSSRSDAAPRTSSVTPRSCLAMRSLRETSPRCSTGRWMP